MISHASPPSIHRRKRMKRSADDSSELSLSEESALAPSTRPEYSTEASDYDSYSGSELSESSEDPSTESASENSSEPMSEGEDEIINVRANRGEKPVMRLGEDDIGPDIRTFLQDFLPQLKAANDELEIQREAGVLKAREIDAEEDQEGAQYIEMNLGLGVLEEKEDTFVESNSEYGSSGAEDTETEQDVLGKLMGKDKIKREDIGIQEVRNG